MPTKHRKIVKNSIVHLGRNVGQKSEWPVLSFHLDFLQGRYSDRAPIQRGRSLVADRTARRCSGHQLPAFSSSCQEVEGVVERLTHWSGARGSERLTGPSLLGRSRLPLGPSNSSSQRLQCKQKIRERLARPGFSET